MSVAKVRRVAARSDSLGGGGITGPGTRVIRVTRNTSEPSSRNTPAIP